MTFQGHNNAHFRYFNKSITTIYLHIPLYRKTLTYKIIIYLHMPLYRETLTYKITSFK